MLNEQQNEVNIPQYADKSSRLSNFSQLQKVENRIREISYNKTN